MCLMSVLNAQVAVDTFKAQCNLFVISLMEARIKQTLFTALIRLNSATAFCALSKHIIWCDLFKDILKDCDEKLVV